MLKVILFGLLFLYICSCKEQKGDLDTQNFLTNQKFDTGVINSISEYEALKNVLIFYRDTLFRFRDQRHYVENLDTHQKKLQKDEFYSFYKSYGTGKYIDDVNLDYMPDFVFKRVDSIFSILGQTKIKGFDLWRDSTIEIYTTSSYDEREEIGASHRLVWKRHYNIEYDNLTKDTALTQDWTYYIDMSKDK
ncbi:MAG TPA: hypothetical protein PKM63_22025 [Panacibacter sp.]|nr:hypothetical protein [Panacibacter sp.]HNP46992.1 hypothetical protein [Panacibacter sp.]